MCVCESACVHVCVHVSSRPTYGSSSPGLLHHFPILFQQSVSNLLRLTALHLSLWTSHIPLPLFMSFSPNLTLSSLVINFPSPLHCLVFYCLSSLTHHLLPSHSSGFYLENFIYCPFSKNHQNHIISTPLTLFLLIIHLPLLMPILLSLPLSLFLIRQLCALNRDVGLGLAHLHRQGCDNRALPEAGCRQSIKAKGHKKNWPDRHLNRSLKYYPTAAIPAKC